MSDNAVNGYADVFGKHAAWIGDHTGPASYVAYTAPATGGDVIQAATYGLRSIDMVAPIGYSVSGNYAVRAKFATAKSGNAATSAILVWFAVTYSTGVEVLTEVANATSLSAETIRLMVVGA